MDNTKISKELEALLCCPVCQAALQFSNNIYKCQNNHEFPVTSGIPILINEKNSIFAIEDFLKQKETFYKLSQEKTLFASLKKLMPDISVNYAVEKNHEDFLQEISKISEAPKVLVVGGSHKGLGLDIILQNKKVKLAEGDVSFGERVQLIFDAHNIPFANASFDGVIIQAVLEHVADPSQCVEEIYRVLKNNGVVYASTPFMQQVHGGPYDFTRFTYLGHRRLFRKFEQIDAGISGGPGMSLSWAYKYFLLSFVKSKLGAHLVTIFAHFTSFFWKYFDFFLRKHDRSYDAASGFYFIGRKSNQILADRELVKLYKGGF